MIENNRLIAEFLGWKEQTDPTERWFGHWFTDEGVRQSDLFFNIDWGDLMKVVDKIEKTNLGSLEIQSKNLVLLQYNQKTDKYYNSTLIENVYNACVEFIKWYNENLTSQTKNETSCK